MQTTFLGEDSRSVHLNCFFTEEDVMRYVETTGISHPFNNKLYVKKGTKVVKENVMLPSQYISLNSIDKTNMTIDKISNMTHFKQNFHSWKDIQ